MKLSLSRLRSLIAEAVDVLEPGYYWVRFKDDERLTVGHYEGPTDKYPWQVVGSDDVFKTDEIEVVARIPSP